MDAIDPGIRPLGLVPGAEQLRTAAWRLRAVRAPGPVLQGVLAFAIYLVVFVIGFALPLVRHLNVPMLRQYWTDEQFYAWSMRWWPYAVSHWTNPLFSNQIGAPHGYDLAWASTTPSVNLLMWPVTAALGVVFAYNVMLVLVPPACGVAAFIVARRLTGRFWAALLAGAVYGFCPFELLHDWQGQPNLTMIALFPLMVYLVLLWWDGTLGRTGFVIWLAIVMALQFYTFNEAFADMTVVAAGAFVIGFAVAGRAAWRKVARLAGLSVAAYVGAIVLASPYLVYALKHNPGLLVRQNPWAFSLWPIRLIVPTPDKMFGLTPLIAYSSRLTNNSIENYVGLPLLLVLLALAVFNWSNRVSRLLAVAFLLVIALALGPDLVIGKRQYYPLPWGRIWSLPIARSAEPSRIIVFGVLVLALALALWLAAPAGSRLVRASRWGLGLLAVAAIFADTPTAYHAVNPVPPGYRPPATMRPVNQLPAFLTAGLYREYLRPGEIVVILSHRGVAGMLFQADANFYFRIAGGYINASLTPVNALPHPVTLLAHPSKPALRTFEDYVRSSGLGAIIVEQAWAEPWMNHLRELGMRGTSVGGVTIYPSSSWLRTGLSTGQSHARQRHSRNARHSVTAAATSPVTGYANERRSLR